MIDFGLGKIISEDFGDMRVQPVIYNIFLFEWRIKKPSSGVVN
jgi:hypothetical protein